MLMESPAAKAQVCGTAGNMAQLTVKPAGLKQGFHSIRVEQTHGAAGDDEYALYWEGPNQPLDRIHIGQTESSFGRRLSQGAGGVAK